jgi:hypothetical protein
LREQVMIHRNKAANNQSVHTHTYDAAHHHQVHE